MLEWRAHYSEWLYVIEAAQHGLDSEVLFVYFMGGVERIGTDESVVVQSEGTTPESGIVEYDG